MEPSEFDQLIKNKVAQESDIHDIDISKSRAIVWSNVQHNLSKNNMPIRYLMAAAVFLFLCTSSYMIHQFLQKQNEQLKLLSNQIENLNQLQASQVKQLVIKDEELGDLKNKISHLEVSLASQKAPSKTFTQVVYKTDTVFITKLESITDTPELGKGIEKNPIKIRERYQEELVVVNNKSDLIYPSFTGSSKKVAQNETVKLKLSTSFVSN